MRETLQITDRSYVIRGGQGAVPRHARKRCLHNPEARKYYFGEGMDLGLGQSSGPHYDDHAAPDYQDAGYENDDQEPSSESPGPPPG